MFRLLHIWFLYFGVLSFSENLAHQLRNLSTWSRCFCHPKIKKNHRTAHLKLLKAWLIQKLIKRLSSNRWSNFCCRFCLIFEAYLFLFLKHFAIFSHSVAFPELIISPRVLLKVIACSTNSVNLLQTFSKQTKVLRIRKQINEVYIFLLWVVLLLILLTIHKFDLLASS